MKENHGATEPRSIRIFSQCLSVSVVVFIMFSVSAEAAELWYEQYDSGLKAVAASDWSAAETRLKAAMQLQPKQGKQVRAYGTRFIRYIPAYYLGVVYFNQGRSADALNQFQNISNSGLIEKGDRSVR